MDPVVAIAAIVAALALVAVIAGLGVAIWRLLRAAMSDT